MRYYSICPESIPPGGECCRVCGSQLDASHSGSRKMSAGEGWLIGLLIGMSIGIGLFFGIVYLAENRAVRAEKRADEAKVTVAEPAPKIKQVETLLEPSARSRTKIVEDTFKLQPGQYRYYTFRIDKPASVRGRFEVRGGSRRDARVILTNPEGLAGFRKHTNFRQWYDSGEATSGALNETINPGDYVLIISNLHSIDSEAMVAPTVYYTSMP